MLEKKKQLAAALEKQNITVIFSENQSRCVFVGVKEKTAMETMFLIKECGCD